MDNSALQVLIGVILAAYCIYMLYTSIKAYLVSRKGMEAYMDVHPEAKKLVLSQWQTWLMAALSVSCFIFASLGDKVAPEGQSVLLYQVVYVCLGLVFIGLTLEVYTHRQIAMTADNFYFAGESYRMRSIAQMFVKKGIFKNYKIKFINGSDLEVTHALGEKIEEAYDAYTAAKRQKRSHKRDK